MKQKIILILIATFLYVNVDAQSIITKNGQQLNVITTAVPLLMIGPDARAGGMGDGGVASSADANSMHWNPAKYARISDDMGFALSYTPWLRNLVNDINLAYVSGYYRIDDNQVVAASLRYFSLGEITFTDINGGELGTFKPNEFAIDATYSRILTDKLSLAVAGRFIYSDLTQGQFVQGVETKPGTSVAADVAMYWEDEVVWFKSIDATFAWGLNISNIGSKISYSGTNIEKDFVPTNLRFGPRLTLDLDDYNSLSFQLDINKLLVPTPPIYADSTNADGTYIIEKGMNPDVSVITGMLQSWYDAPGGFSEEMREFSFAIGAEYWYTDVLALRGGFYYEDLTKGNRKYATLGVGLRYNVFGLDFSYLIPVTQDQNPLQNTLRFSLLFNLGGANKATASK
ncbi:MAG: type IX secretion system outer membrane channel protein PorV [Bacteroidetes bacterium]|nr:type IX secretion system outer membrane channel protein PorV [Bacteroidota bacterium]MBL6943961.1 type IX secretion system outer membrane channel protein PorV [Bacteroidales bacterium]